MYAAETALQGAIYFSAYGLMEVSVKLKEWIMIGPLTGNPFVCLMDCRQGYSVNACIHEK